MTSDAKSPDEYVDGQSGDRKQAVMQLRAVIKKNLPSGFKETMAYGMIGYVVPLERYPSGYHVNPELPLPYINLASQKNFIAIYHFGLYASPSLLSWFKEAYPRNVKTRLDMGKSCIRFKNTAHIPYELIGELCSKMSVDEWIEIYEKNTNQKGTTRKG